jgi:hypothetical protein
MGEYSPAGKAWWNISGNYTVLSAHRPNEKQDELPKYCKGQSPDWNALVRTVEARNPEKNHSWAQNAVRQYRYFIDLKLDPKLAGQKFSLSAAVDEIWHTHLSFLDRYQRDMVCLTKGNIKIVEHLPLHMEHATDYYEMAHEQHSERMAEINCLPVDAEFWPTPMPYDSSEYKNSSDDEEMTGRVVRGGKPKTTRGRAKRSIRPGARCAPCG